MSNWPQHDFDQLRVLSVDEELRHRPPGTPEQRHKWNIARRDLFLAVGAITWAVVLEFLGVLIFG